MPLLRDIVGFLKWNPEKEDKKKEVYEVLKRETTWTEKREREEKQEVWKKSKDGGMKETPRELHTILALTC